MEGVRGKGKEYDRVGRRGQGRELKVREVGEGRWELERLAWREWLGKWDGGGDGGRG